MFLVISHNCCIIIQKFWVITQNIYIITPKLWVILQKWRHNWTLPKHYARVTQCWVGHVHLRNFTTNLWNNQTTKHIIFEMTDHNQNIKHPRNQWRTNWTATIIQTVKCQKNVTFTSQDTTFRLTSSLTSCAEPR